MILAVWISKDTQVDSKSGVLLSRDQYEMGTTEKTGERVIRTGSADTATIGSAKTLVATRTRWDTSEALFDDGSGDEFEVARGNRELRRGLGDTSSSLAYEEGSSIFDGFCSGVDESLSRAYHSLRRALHAVSNVMGDVDPDIEAMDIEERIKASIANVPAENVFYESPLEMKMLDASLSGRRLEEVLEHEEAFSGRNDAEELSESNDAVVVAPEGFAKGYTYLLSIMPAAERTFGREFFCPFRDVTQGMGVAACCCSAYRNYGMHTGTEDEAWENLFIKVGKCGGLSNNNSTDDPDGSRCVPENLDHDPLSQGFTPAEVSWTLRWGGATAEDIKRFDESDPFWEDSGYQDINGPSFKSCEGHTCCPGIICLWSNRSLKWHDTMNE